jgi:Lrp/AsnC family leucine-responsive transcriptional regulator
MKEQNHRHASEATSSAEQSIFLPVSIDATDRAILRLLQENAKLSVREIAARVHLSATPVHDRIKRLEQTGVIQQYVALVNPAKLAPGLTVFCYISLKEHSKTIGAAFIERLRSYPEVIACYSISGQHDFMLHVLARDMEHYRTFHVHRLGELEAIQQVHSVFVMEVLKQTFPAV